MTPTRSFLHAAARTAEAQALVDGDQRDLGYVMNLTRVWAHQPATKRGLTDLLDQCVQAGSLSMRQRGILVASCASAMGDAYCSLAWGGRLAQEAGDELAAGVLRGDTEALDPSEQVLARWARQVARDPNATTADDVEALRQAGFSDAQVFAITAFVALRIAFSTVNDALGAAPDHEMVDRLPAPVRDAVTFGRAVDPPLD